MPGGTSNPNSRANLHPPGKPGPGRPKNAGLSIKEWMNCLAASRISDAELYRIAKGQRQIRAKRIAAGRLIQASQLPDMADFDKFFEGEKLTQLRKKGVDTTVVKKHKTREIPQGNDKNGNPLPPIIEHEIELKDAGLANTEHVVEQTDGKPAITMQGPGGNPVVAGVLVLPPEMPPQ